MATSYLNKCRASLPALRASLERSEFEAMRISGHNLKGTGGAYGFQALTAIGASMEHAASDQSAGELQKQLAALEGYLSVIEVAASD